MHVDKGVPAFDAFLFLRVYTGRNMLLQLSKITFSFFAYYPGIQSSATGTGQLYAVAL